MLDFSFMILDYKTIQINQDKPWFDSFATPSEKIIALQWRENALIILAAQLSIDLVTIFFVENFIILRAAYFLLFGMKNFPSKKEKKKEWIKITQFWFSIGEVEKIHLCQRNRNSWRTESSRCTNKLILLYVKTKKMKFNGGSRERNSTPRKKGLLHSWKS